MKTSKEIDKEAIRRAKEIFKETSEVPSWERLIKNILGCGCSLGQCKNCSPVIGIIRQTIISERKSAVEEYLKSDEGGVYQDYLKVKSISNEQIRKQAITDFMKDVIDLSDRIEAENEAVFDEWRAFKQFRNTLRDKYGEKR